VIMAVEIIEQFTEVHVKAFQFAFRKIKLIDADARCGPRVRFPVVLVQ
jgi:hypothetical protein